MTETPEELKARIKFGWLKDKPDVNDYPFMARPEVIAVLPASVDLRAYDTTIENQGNLGSCTAHAGTGIFEWLAKYKTGKYVDGSRSFLYKEAQDRAGLVGDVGAYLRDTAAVLADEGLPPESIWSYSMYPQEPTPAVKAEAIKSHADSYWRLDPAGSTNAQLLNNIKVALTTTVRPPMFGFICYNSIFSVGSSGMIPIPSGEAEAGGHAVMAIGYDDAKSALLIKNSWGLNWGANGYGWLPYWYVNNDKVDDCWLVATRSDIIDVILTPTQMTLSATSATA